jgi:integrase
MPTRKLTDLFVERVKPPARDRIEYFDAAFGGLALRVTATGHKSWSLYYRIHGRLRRFTMGSYPSIKPAQARREAAVALESARQGTDPSEEKRIRRQSPAAEVDTFGALVKDYLDRARRNMASSTYREMKRAFERDTFPVWRDRTLASLTRVDINKVIDGIGARGAEVQANRMLGMLRALFNWAVERGRLSESPVAGMKPPTRERARDRALTDDEVRWLWQACEALEWPFGPVVKLLLLTAQRRDEVAGMEWSEIDIEKGIWRMPREKAKNNRAHEVQLSAAAIEVLNSIPRVGHGLVFTSTGRTPVSGFSRAKRRLDAAMLAAKRQELGAECDAIPHWILHDLRRTSTTGMARLNFPPHVVDKVLNHTSGTIRGVAAVYNRFEYLDERREALEAWGQYLRKLVSPVVGANVIELRR